jgi:malonyl-CoA O-methyltransferase
VGKSFHKQASEYDGHASVQKRVVKRVISLVQSHMPGSPDTILDVGCGTGQLLAALKDLYPQAGLYGVDLASNMLQCAAQRLGSDAILLNADAEQLPFERSSIDLLVSTSTLQWLDSLDIFFQQSELVLSNNGLLCVAFFGGNTLCELRDCFQTAVERRTGSSATYTNSLHHFMGREDVEQALGKSGFTRAIFMNDVETEYYNDLPDLLRSIKRIGAGTTTKAAGGAGLGWKGIINDAGRIYAEKYEMAGKIPATYEVIYVVAYGRNAG